jgi:hypothetical protein
MPVTPEQLNNAEQDIETIGAVANGAADLNGDGTTTNRNGDDLKTLARLQAEYQEIIDAQEVQEELASASAADAAQSAAYAGGFETPEYASQSAGNAATTAGQIFRVPLGTSPQTFAWYRRLSSGSELVSPLVTRAAITNRPGPMLDDYASLGDTSGTTQLQRYLADSSGEGLPLYLNRPIVLGETIVMTPGAKIVSAGGPLNVVTKFFTEPTAPGLMQISVEPGFEGAAFEVPANCYDAYFEGLWLDLRNQVSGDGIAFNEDLVGGGTASIIYRSGSVVRRCKVFNAAGRGIWGADKHHEINLFNVLIQNTRGLAASYLEGGDYTIDQLWAQDSAEHGHYFKNAAEIRIGHIESWGAGKNNFRIEGFSRGITINRLISDIAGEHGVLFTQAAGDTHMPDQVRIMNGRSTTSGNKAGGSNQFDDWHFDDQDGTYGGQSRIHISGIAGGPSAQPTRHNIGATIAASTNFRALCRWRISDFSFHPNSTVAGTRESIMNAAARQVIRFGPGVSYGGTGNPEPVTQGPTTGVHNLVQNGDFSSWSGTTPQPDGWLPLLGATLSLDTVNTFEGRPSLKITAGASIGSCGVFHVPVPQRYRGKRMTAAVRILNNEAEGTAFNTRVRISTPSVIADYLVGVASGIQYIPLSFDVPSDATILAFTVSPAAVAAASGRSVSIQDVVWVEGNQIPDVVPSNPADTLGWHSIQLAPASAGANVALDARFGGNRFRLTATQAGTFVGIVNAKPMQEILLLFADSNLTLATFSNLKRADGSTAPRQIAAGTIVRAVFDGNNWICDLPGAFVPRSATIAQLPTSGDLEGGLWLCSDLGGDSALVAYRGGKYRRLYDGAPVAFSNTTDMTLDWLTHSNVVRLTGTLAAARTLTLDTTRAAIGATWHISRTGGGAFDWTIAGTTITIAQNQWVEIRLEAGGPVLVKRGTL